MRKPVLCFLSFVFLFASSLLVNAGNPPVSKWTVKNPFEQKVFIENKGQYNLSNKLQSKDILFSARLDGLEYYFTANGIYIAHYNKVKRTEEELKQLQLPVGLKNSNSFEYKYVQELHQINFIGANPSAEIIGNNVVKQYYNFRIKGITTIKAFAYKKLTYKNLYLGIDMEFYFPDGKQGFEYSFIVHPGADVSQIKMQYPLNEGINITPDGNIAIQSAFGEFTDQAPVADQQGILKNITCSFNLTNGIVQFNTADYDKTQDLIIDPWTITPHFQGNVTGRCFDLDWDNAGNCYIYGGVDSYPSDPFGLIKYDSTGTELWVTYTDDYLYGGFAVDRNSQSIYISEGADILTGAQILKLDQGGRIIDTSAGNLYMVAMFRIAYSSQYNEVVVAGGSYPGSPAATAMYIDTNLSNGTLVYVLNPPNPYHYMWGLTLDNSGNCYMATSYFWADTSLFNNQMFKLPMPTLSPTTWEVRDGYQIQTYQPLYIIPHNNGEGLNGMTVSDTNLYTYDSYTLKKWDTTNGNLLNTLNINGDSTKPSYWSGLTNDSCGDIFLGSHDTIKEYNSNLELLNNIVSPDTIYDLKFGENNMLYACGASFVSVIQLTPHLVSANNTSSDTTLYYKVCLGNSVALKAQGAVGYTWLPSAGLNTTIGDSVSATPSVTTTYTVICAGILSCSTANDTFNIVVTVNPLPKINILTHDSSICLGQSTSLVATGASTYNWSPSAKLNTNIGDSVVATPSSTTTYLVTGTDSFNCTATDTIVISVNSPPNTPIITKNGDLLTSSATQGNQWLLNDTAIAGATNKTYTVTSIGCYSVSATNIVNGCSSTSDTVCITKIETGINQLSVSQPADQLSVYPNPTSNQLIIFSNRLSINSIEIYDVLGQIIYKSPLGDLGIRQNIDVSAFPTGIYFYRITTSNSQIFIGKFVKE